MELKPTSDKKEPRLSSTITTIGGMGVGVRRGTDEETELDNDRETETGRRERHNKMGSNCARTIDVTN